MERKDAGNTDAFRKLVDGKSKYMVADLGGELKAIQYLLG